MKSVKKDNQVSQEEKSYISSVIDKYEQELEDWDYSVKDEIAHDVAIISILLMCLAIFVHVFWVR